VVTIPHIPVYHDSQSNEASKQITISEKEADIFIEMKMEKMFSK
jgi:hypothetical protein